MRIVVIGGSGYVGSLILPGLADAGHEVCVLDPAAPAGGPGWVPGKRDGPGGPG